MHLFKRRTIYFMLMLPFSFGCGTKIRTENGFEIKTVRKERITIVGQAEEAKGGAIVFTKDEQVYYIGRRKDWNKKKLNQEIKVSGRLFEETYTKLDSTRIVQERKRKLWIKFPIISRVKIGKE